MAQNGNDPKKGQGTNDRDPHNPPVKKQDTISSFFAPNDSKDQKLVVPGAPDMRSDGEKQRDKFAQNYANSPAGKAAAAKRNGKKAGGVIDSVMKKYKKKK